MQTPCEESPYSLMQERYRSEPWRLLVGCICLNQVSAKVARPVWEKIFQKWPLSVALQKMATKDELVDLLRPLGFQNRRAERILRMTDDYIHAIWECGSPLLVDPLKLHGIGKYGADSYNMFVKGELVEDVEDKELKNYLSWAKEYHERRQRGTGGAG